jgi:hypothetical protein
MLPDICTILTCCIVSEGEKDDKFLIAFSSFGYTLITADFDIEKGIGEMLRKQLRCSYDFVPLYVKARCKPPKDSAITTEWKASIAIEVMGYGVKVENNRIHIAAAYDLNSAVTSCRETNPSQKAESYALEVDFFSPKHPGHSDQTVMVSI